MARRLRVFVATAREQVPPGCARYVSVDGAVPGAAQTWDHHQTGEPTNLDALPPTFSLSGYDGVGTTLADTDALASVVALLAGGPATLPAAARAVLACASHHCDHLRPHPAYGAVPNRAGERLDNYVATELAAVPPSRRSARFSRLCRDIYRALPGPFPGRRVPPWAPLVARAEAEGRLSTHGAVLLVDLSRSWRAPVRPDAWYRARPDCRVAVVLDAHPQGGRRYTVGQNPFAGEPTDVRPALEALAAAEFAHGPPAVGPEPRPGAENWGGRREVGGSPWNYGSRLLPQEVVDLVGAALV